ncbi:MAG: 50S ribosomal protein L6 [Candidatus Latescibacterota bacterium]|jgi:large subunit ribosomal protein L6
MSRVGLKPIQVPSGVTVSLDGYMATVKGPKGTITKELPDTCDFKQEGDVINVSRRGEARVQRQMHGLSRALLNNMVVGVTDGFSKELEIIGVGFRAEVKGKELILSLGYSHPIHFPVPDGLTIEVEGTNKIKISGIEKDKVGQAAAEIRGFRPPEPYKGKGVKYVDETIRRKAGKTAAGGA